VILGLGLDLGLKTRIFGLDLETLDLGLPPKALAQTSLALAVALLCLALASWPC